MGEDEKENPVDDAEKYKELWWRSTWQESADL